MTFLFRDGRVEFGKRLCEIIHTALIQTRGQIPMLCQRNDQDPWRSLQPPQISLTGGLSLFQSESTTALLNRLLSARTSPINIPFPESIKHATLSQRLAEQSLTHEALASLSCGPPPSLSLACDRNDFWLLG